ncbi:MAG: hypothetical protein GWP10_09550 [Nitrospiraceae bacterium]|nr:hypothetical protein [Nitrospiraceae bacterium]
MKLFNNLKGRDLKRISCLNLLFLTTFLISNAVAAKQVIRVGFLTTQKSARAEIEVSAAYNFLKNKIRGFENLIFTD